MHKIYSICLATILTVFINAAPVQALEPITYVSGKGSDANACTLAAPCRNFTRAIAMVAGNGVIRALDLASFGTVNITRSLTIDGGGNIVALGTRITINNASAIVVLRGLVMDGRALGTGLNGILIYNAAAVQIEDCEIARYTSDGIQVAGAGGTDFFLSGTILRDNVSSGLTVYDVNAHVTIENSRAENNGLNGFEFHGLTANVIRSVASRNANGLNMAGATASFTETAATDNGNFGYALGAGTTTLTSSLARDNSTGVQVSSGASVLITDSVIYSNSNAAITNAGSLFTRQNNTVTLGSYSGNPPVNFSAF